MGVLQLRLRILLPLLLFGGMVWAKPAEVKSRVKRQSILEKGATFHLDAKKVKSVRFSSENVKGGEMGEWVILGDESCKPELSCEGIELGEDCDEEFFRVRDGIGGEAILCENADLSKPVVASEGGRDLFVLYSPGDDTRSPIQCQAKCSPEEDVVVLSQDYVPKEDTRCVCGLQNKDDRIVGGEDSKLNEFPWQTALVFEGTREPFCGATIINEEYVLTAAHCFYFSELKAPEVEVLFHAFVLDQTTEYGARDVALGERGSTRSKGYNLSHVSDEDEQTQRHKVAEIIMHPLFTEDFDYDYALLRLQKKVNLGAADAPTPVCLPEVNFAETFEEGIPWVVGWGKGHEDAGGTTRVLQKLEVPVIEHEKCNNWMEGVVTSRMICAGYEDGEKDACTGDSGGPLILQQPNKQWEQIGIVSWGEGCAGAHKPGLYSRITESLPWINYYANKNDPKWCKTSK